MTKRYPEDEAREILKPLAGRCLRCAWPLRESRKDGCVPGDCSYREPGFTPCVVSIEAATLQALLDRIETLEESSRRFS